MNYSESVVDELNGADAVLWEVEEFKKDVRDAFLIDGDGIGYPVKNGMYDSKWLVHPSQLNLIPLDATHVLWYNK